eukprot:CAMPEP_0206520630 /NCGR_PEP_ID=MMETSP0324_2-20121206/65856_1 /ASSEMBLY_ACC=CAM_ASM_000836 /TAXON_ID=2866 /ORGANISM="Crypthecodinium cohnii, Strain Seligo" /LENGTH=134 /DNA_ID=CAMNT_0054014349 /DNA_START=96 /DNA_END=497 /DNA_ORIENTATION=+
MYCETQEKAHKARSARLTIGDPESAVYHKDHQGLPASPCRDSEAERVEEPKTQAESDGHRVAAKPFQPISKHHTSEDVEHRKEQFTPGLVQPDVGHEDEGQKWGVPELCRISIQESSPSSKWRNTKRHRLSRVS